MLTGLYVVIQFIISTAVISFCLYVLLSKARVDACLHLIQAGQHIFRVHRYFFEKDSQSWFDKLQTGSTAAPGSEPIGTADSNAIILDPSVKSDDLAKFLWVFYNP